MGRREYTTLQHLNDKATRAAIEKSKHPNLPHSDADPYVREWKEEFVKQRYYVTNFEIDVVAVLGQLSHRASYNESGSGSIDVTTVSYTHLTLPTIVRG